MLTHTKNQEVEENIHQYLKSNGEDIERDDVELEYLSEEESAEYEEILKDMKNGNFVKFGV